MLKRLKFLTTKLDECFYIMGAYSYFPNRKPIWPKSLLLPDIALYRILNVFINLFYVNLSNMRENLLKLDKLPCTSISCFTVFIKL